MLTSTDSPHLATSEIPPERYQTSKQTHSTKEEQKNRETKSDGDAARSKKQQQERGPAHSSSSTLGKVSRSDSFSSSVLCTRLSSGAFIRTSSSLMVGHATCCRCRICCSSSLRCSRFC